MAAHISFMYCILFKCLLACRHFIRWKVINNNTWLKGTFIYHYDDVIMGAAASPASRLFTQWFIQAQIIKNIKGPRHWPLCGEFIGDRWIPRTKGQLRGKCFHLMTSSWDNELGWIQISSMWWRRSLVHVEYFDSFVYETNYNRTHAVISKIVTAADEGIGTFRNASSVYPIVRSV